MFSVAVIGADGAGTTTIARKLEKSFPLPTKYLYMGINIESSDVALPTSRLIEFLKRLLPKKSGAGRNLNPSIRRGTNQKRPIARKLWIAIRLVNRLAEEWYRQILSWKYQKKGQNRCS